MQKFKKLLILSHEFPPFGGGGGAVMELLCRELHDRGNSLEVWTSNIPAKQRQSFPYRVRYFPSLRSFRFETNYLAIIMYLLQISIAGLFLRNSNRLVIFSNMTIPAGISGAFISWIRRIPHVTWHHGAEIHGNNLQKGAPAIYRFALKLIWKNTAVNFFVSESLRLRANSYSKVPNSSILPVAVKTSPSGSPSDRKHKMFLFAGRLEPVKNPDLFLRAAFDIVARGSCPDAVFRLIGSGSLFSQASGGSGKSGRG